MGGWIAIRLTHALTHTRIVECCSAKSGNCVEEAFLHIARNIIGKLPSKSAGAPTSSTATIHLDPKDKDKPKKKCC